MLELLGFSWFGFALFVLWTAGVCIGTLFVARANKDKAKAVTDAVNKELERAEKIIKKSEKKAKK